MHSLTFASLPRVAARLTLLGILTVTSAASAQEGAAEEDHYGRFRWGVSGQVGPMLGDVSGVVGGVNARLGVQLSELIGIYAQPTSFAGAAFDVSPDDGDASLGLWGMGALCDFTLNDRLYLAAGPELFVGGVGQTSIEALGGTAFSMIGRAGVYFGKKELMRRSAFQLGLDLHLVFGEGRTLALPLLTAGYEAY